MNIRNGNMLKQFIQKSGHRTGQALIVCLAGTIGACGGGASTTPAEPSPTNNAPTISGAPPTSVVAGQAYSFTPTASDPDGDALNFTISNQPIWATFDAADGSLTGTPVTANTGPHPNVSITVSDGQLNAALTAFSIDVEALPAGSILLSWTPPTLSADGSMLDDLRGFRIRWGVQTGTYPNLMEVNDPNADISTVSNLSSATYFFVVSAVDVSGNESANSNEVTIAVP